MKVTPIVNPLPGERVAAVWPRMAPRVAPTWHRRLNLYTGRTLSDTALSLEQKGRDGRLTTLAQMLSPGVVTGLELDLELDALGKTRIVHVAPGVGLSASGEDVVVPKTLRINEAELIGLLSPDERTSVLQSHLGILLLEPVTVRRFGRFDAEDPCDIDTDPFYGGQVADAFADEQDIDGCRVVLWPWESSLQLAPEATFRNRVAHRIFELEAALPSGEIQPWETRGVPVGVIGFNVEEDLLSISWVDRHSVVRLGGKAKPRAPLVTGVGNAMLWQARLQQFVEQLYEQSNIRMKERIGAFAYLPPVGMLPLEAADLKRGTNDFFPPTWAVRAVPLPIEEIDEVIARCASLAPLATNQGERVLLLVPVPQAVYEPRLLTQEVVSPLFQQRISEFALERESKRYVRMAVRRDYRALVRAVNGLAAVPMYADPGLGRSDTAADPDALSLEPALTPLQARTDPAGGRFDVEGEGPELEKLAVSPLLRLRDRLRNNFIPGTKVTLFTSDELMAFDAATGLDKYVPANSDVGLRSFERNAGLDGYVRALRDKIQQADDLIDLSFLKSHTNIYRVRQHLLGSTASMRLATSPALAEIVKGQSAEAVTDEVNRYFYAIKGRLPGTLAPVTASEVSAAEPRASVVALQVERLATPSYLRTTGVINASSLLSAAEARPSLKAKPVLGRGGFELIEDGAVELELARIVSPKATTVQNAAPITGDGAYDFRTVSITQRIMDPASKEAKAYAVAARAEVVQALQILEKLKMNVADITIFGVPELDAAKKPTFDQSTGLPKRCHPTFSDLNGDFSLILNDPAPANADEAGFFSETVTIIEHLIATLRAIEGRVAAYRAELAICEQVLEQVKASKARAATKLAELDTDVSEARHKWASVKALLADEIQRVAAINSRRQTVLREQVQFLAYVRPHFIDTSVNAPLVQLNPGLIEPTIPSCLASRSDVPPEIERMVQLLREAPCSWFVNLPKLLEKLDRVELLHGTLQVAKTRASTLLDANRILSTFADREPVGRFGPAIAKATDAQRSVIAQCRVQSAAVDLARFAGVGWRQTVEEAVHIFSPGDLIESNHGRSSIVDAVTRELAQIAQVAGCLHEHVCDVLPAIRLAWADRLNQFEGIVNLRGLTILPRWGEVEFALRREMQTVVDWLYGRMDPARTDATTWMHDLVRVCLLLACHAPVNEIIAGHVPVPTRVAPGQTVPVTIDPGKVRLGMKVLFYKALPVVDEVTAPHRGPEIVAHGFVEDLVGGQARARIVETFSDEVTFDAGTRAQFVHPESRDLPTFLRKFI